MNRGQIRSFTGLWTSDPNDTRYTATVKNNIIDVANERFAVDAKCVFKYKDYTILTDTATYDLPSDFMWERDAQFDGGMLRAASRYTLGRTKQESDWKDQKGSPTDYIIDPEGTRKEIRLYPIPESSDAGKTVTMAYFAKPSDMSSDSDEPLNGDSNLIRFHMAVAVLSSWMLLGYEDLTPSIDAKMTKLWALYQYYVKEALDTYANTSTEAMTMRGGRNYRP